MYKEQVLDDCLNGQGNIYGNRSIEKRSITSLIREKAFTAGKIGCVLLAVAGSAATHYHDDHMLDNVPSMSQTELVYQHQLGQETLKQTGQECYLVGPSLMSGGSSSNYVYRETINAQTADYTNNNVVNCNTNGVTQYKDQVKVFHDWGSALKEYQAHANFIHIEKDTRSNYS